MGVVSRVSAIERSNEISFGDISFGFIYIELQELRIQKHCDDTLLYLIIGLPEKS